MPLETLLTHATVVTRDDSFIGTVQLQDGLIADVQPGISQLPNAIDIDGDWLVPGLIELHTDNVEHHLEPRPGVEWPSSIAALMAHDAQVAGAGITTVLDSMCVGDYSDDGRRAKLLERTVDAVDQGRKHGLLRSDHLVHLRCELSDPDVVETFARYAEHPHVRLVSLMDHTPGQRQWRDISKMREFHSRRRTYTDAELDAYIADRQDRQARYAEANREAIVALWSVRQQPLATHDDTTVEHVEQALSEGVTISEFPTTFDAAQHARAHDMRTIMGAPNLVRGGSHSGNVSAGELADAGLLCGLSSDYAPISLLHGAMTLYARHGFSAADAFATVTSNVAEMLALDDRGEIAVGKRADIVRLRPLHDGSAGVMRVWREGEVVS